MHWHIRNVNEAFRDLVAGIDSGRVLSEVRPSRYGEVLVVEEPVIVTYEEPLERVLFNAARDCNPWFHVYESLWMLAGRNDVAPLAYYNKRMMEFSDDGETLRGAYGYRWIQASTQTRWVNQLDKIVDHLKAKPESRRAVLQMWNVEDDLLAIDTSKDVCCNTHIYFLIRQRYCPECKGRGWVMGGRTHEEDYLACPGCGGKPQGHQAQLEMTVCNRSNDLIWGMLGANVVHFSFLQEYLASRLGIAVGWYHQFTNNLHAYTNTWRPAEWLAEYGQGGARSDLWYGSGNVRYIPLVKDPVTFDREVKTFVEANKDGLVYRTNLDGARAAYSEPFLHDVARPMMMAWHRRKVREYAEAVGWADQIKADDWRVACLGWLERRAKNHVGGKGGS